jgi:hypothetical protein
LPAPQIRDRALVQLAFPTERIGRIREKGMAAHG